MDIIPTLNLVWNKVNVDITNYLTAIQNELTVNITGYLVAIQNNIDVDIIPTLNLVWNKVNVDITNYLTAIQNELTVNITGYLVAIQNNIDVDIIPTLNLVWNKVNVDITNYLTAIQNELTVNITGYLVAIQNNIDVDIIPTLNLVWNKVNVDITNYLTAIQNELTVNITGYLVAIQNNIDVDIIPTLNLSFDLLTGIQESLDVKPTLYQDDCKMPQLPPADKPMPDEITPYIYSQKEIIGQGFSQSISLLSSQISRVFEEICKMKKVYNFQELECCEGADCTDPKDIEQGYRMIIHTPTSIEVGLQILQKEINTIQQQLVCSDKADNSCSVLIPDPSAVWNTEGYYIFFHWKIENPQNDNEKRWSNSTQLASPISGLINSPEPEKVWDNYFAGIYQILGNQWGELRTKNKARRYPLYKGWFQDKDEARRFLNSIKNLTTIETDDKNNPSFPEKDNQSTRLVNQGKKIILRKVCIGLKNPDTDQVDILQGYSPPKKP